MPLIVTTASAVVVIIVVGCMTYFTPFFVRTVNSTVRVVRPSNWYRANSYVRFQTHVGDIVKLPAYQQFRRWQLLVKQPELLYFCCTEQRSELLPVTNKQDAHDLGTRDSLVAKIVIVSDFHTLYTTITDHNNNGYKNTAWNSRERSWETRTKYLNRVIVI